MKIAIKKTQQLKGLNPDRSYYKIFLEYEEISFEEQHAEKIFNLFQYLNGYFLQLYFRKRRTVHYLSFKVHNYLQKNFYQAPICGINCSM
jgi:hypothetical protein